MTMPGQHILFADDDVMTQWIMTDVLTGAGFTVTSVCRGVEAIGLLDGAADFDLLLTDVDLPDSLDGHALADHWHRTLPRCPVIYTGARRNAGMPMLHRHEHFIEKPLGAAKLLRLVDRALEEANFGLFLPDPARRRLYVH